MMREQEVLRRFLVDLGDYIKSQPDEPAKGSPADLLGHPERALAAYRTGLALVDSMDEHARLFLDAMDRPVKLLAACSCARVVLELSARVFWLLNPELEPAERLARIYAHRHGGIVQYVKYLRSENQPFDEYEECIEKLAVEAHGLGVPVARGCKGQLEGVGKPLNATAIASKLKAESLYRLFSAALHGHYWAIHRLDPKDVSVDRLVYLVGIVGLDFAPAPSALVDYMGWDSDPWWFMWRRLYSGLRLEQLVARAIERHGDG